MIGALGRLAVRQVDTKPEAPARPFDAAQLVGGLMAQLPPDPAGTGFVHLRRDAMQSMLITAAEWGAAHQAAIHTRQAKAAAIADAKAREAARPPFPPVRIVRGGRRLWLVALAVLALVEFPHFARLGSSACANDAAAAFTVWQADLATQAGPAVTTSSGTFTPVKGNPFAPPAPTLNCAADGIPTAVIAVLAIVAAAALASWAAYRVLLWVVRGFRSA